MADVIEMVEVSTAELKELLALLSPEDRELYLVEIGLSQLRFSTLMKQPSGQPADTVH
jgi:hypothetical protein